MRRGTIFGWILFAFGMFAAGLFIAASMNRLPSVLIDEPDLGIEACPRDEVAENALVKKSAERLEKLHPTVRQGAEDLIRLSKSCYGIDIRVTQGYRTKKEQDALFSQGRSTSGEIVTNARGGESMHNYGLAFDFVLLKPDGGITYDLNHDGNGSGKNDWNEIGMLGKALGFEWGGDWTRFKDVPHFEMTFGHSLNDLKKGKRPAKSLIADRTDEIEELLGK